MQRTLLIGQSGAMLYVVDVNGNPVTDGIECAEETNE